MAEHRYKLKTTGKSSSWFGACEICGEHAPEVFIQTKEQRFVFDDVDRRMLGTNEKFGWSHVSTTFGHEQCLAGRQATAEPHGRDK